MIEQAGFLVLGPVGSVDQALALLKHSECEAAVLDVNLGNETAEPIARRLSESATPFILLSGCSRDQLPSGLCSAPLVGKAANAALLVASLERCLEGLQ